MARASDGKANSYRGVFVDILSALTKTCQEVYGGRLVSLAVFGSVGRERPRPDSDIDVLLVVDSLPQGRMARMEEFEAVEERLEPTLAEARRQGVDTRLSPLLRARDEMTPLPPFIDMALEARLLFDRGRFLVGYVDQLKQELAGRGAARVTDRGPVHWRLGTGKGVSERDPS